MRNMLAAALLFLTPFAGVADDLHPQLRLAVAAQQAGDIALAEYYLEDFLRQDPDRDDRPAAVRMLAEVYWVQGKDKLLLDFTDRELGKRDREVWWCRVLERRGNAREAARCWEKLGEVARMERTIRSSTMTEELAPTKSYLGHRPD